MAQESKETNINVVLRLRFSQRFLIPIRPRNAKEIKENSPVVISTRQKEVSVKIMENTSKTYSFDKVFGPESGQNVVFQEVVVPMLDEVLMGYNCTIFAYGLFLY
jgi:kinesin family protein 11